MLELNKNITDIINRNEARKRVNDLSISVNEITEITNMINGIADQTNLLNVSNI